MKSCKPNIPEEMPPVEDLAAMVARTRECEEDIERVCVRNVQLSDLDARKV